MANFSIRECFANEASITPSVMLSKLVRTMIDGEYAANMSFEDLIRQLNEVAGEVESTRGLNISNAERMGAMQSLAWELQAGSLQMAA
jgi:hypothetical protein